MKRNAIILLFFILSALIYFHNVFTENRLLAVVDGLNYFYPLMSVVAEQYKSGILPLWNSYMFSGFPLMASSQPGALYPLNIALILLFPAHIAYNLDVVLHIALAGFFTYLYARKIRIEVFPSFIAGSIFAFLGYLMPHIMHLSVLHTAVWLPLILYFFENLRVRTGLRSALSASIPIAMQIFAGHPQIYFYTYIILFLFVLFHSFHISSVTRIKFIGLSITALAIGIIIGSPQLYATYELYSLGIRPSLSYEIFSSHSFPLKMLPSFLFPLAYNKDGYIGVLPILLALVTLWRGWKHDVHIRFWGFIAVLTFILALGDTIGPLHRILFHVPVYNSFRGVSKHLIEFNFSLCILSALGISFIIQSRKAKKYIASLIILLFSITIISLLSFLLSDSSRLSTPAVYRPLIVISVYLLCLVVIQKTGRYRFFKHLIIFAVLLEVISLRNVEGPLVSVANKYKSEVFTSLAEKGDRVAFLSGHIAFPLAMRYGVSMVDGYDPFILDDYRLLLGIGGTGGLSTEWRDLIENNLILSLLNARYVFVPPAESSFIETVKGQSWEDGNNYPLYRKILATPEFSIYENLNCLPRVFSVSELFALNTITEIKGGFYAHLINPRTQAFISKDDLKEIGTNRFSQGNVKILKYKHNTVVSETDFRGKGFVVLADQYYPGWRAFIDERPVKIYKTDGILRGVIVPAGIHELSFKYSPARIYVLLMVSIVTLIALTVTLFLKRS